MCHVHLMILDPVGAGCQPELVLMDLSGVGASHYHLLRFMTAAQFSTAHRYYGQANLRFGNIQWT